MKDRRRTRTGGDRRIPTLADVAALACVNASTVSRVLSGSPKIKPATRERVLQAVRELNYRPSHSARSLASRRSMTVGVLLPDLRNLMHADFLEGVQRVMQPHGYSLLICDGQVDPNVQEAELERLLAARVDALLVTRSFTLPQLLTPFESAEVPVEPVEVLRSPTASGRALRARRAGSMQAYAELLRLGHRRFGFFIRARRDAPRLSAEMRSRLRALESTLESAGIDPGDAIDVVHVDEPAECVARLSALMAAGSPPTALIASNDWMSAPLLAARGALGLRIPEDVSVLCYGDSYWAEAYRPPVSVIRYDYRQEGAVVAHRLLARLGIEASTPAAGQPLAPDEFVSRQSLGPPPRRVPPRRRTG